ncbi:ultraviolet-B receptor UVR8 isoform X2 [Solanum tuberosum]|uniref:ultraviolet-B receptor UVR8 isoform X2 n=1 Tax=Solanum tuberosum TaxID=4113 RepID=UPI0003D27815|nr:PREDICTED: ultraviolet-B receptor UVR8 isoform X2 [Solanum tuberosum]
MIVGRAVTKRSLWFVRWISVSSVELNGKQRFAALWGNGDHGRLGHGSLESQWRPNVLPSSAFDNQNLREIACGGAHSLFLTDHGRVYASGLNDYGQLGVSDDRAYITEPLGVAGLPKEIVKVSAGYHHSSAISVDGELYMWGKNTNGQLGLGKKAATVLSIPNKVECLNGVTIKIISLGFEHSIAVTDKGETLSWGGGQSGRLGHGHQSGIFGLIKSDSEYTPRLIKELEGLKVKNASAGMLHSVSISATENGSVHIFGERANKKLGFSEASNSSLPSMVDGLPYSEKAACGGYHTCVITGGGELYVWGTNENGCLGIGSTDVAHLPERVEGPFLRHSVSEVSCGWKHTAAISGNVYTWGWGGSHGTFSVDGHSSGGQLGQGNDVDYIKPTKINFPRHVKALQVSCGFNHTGAIFEYS